MGSVVLPSSGAIELRENEKKWEIGPKTISHFRVAEKIRPD